MAQPNPAAHSASAMCSRSFPDATNCSAAETRKDDRGFAVNAAFGVFSGDVLQCRTRWRRERDSNPRYGFPYSGFQDRLFQPLTHPSA
jgi:hypothetical protein